MRVTHVITRLIVGGAQENTVASVLGLRERHQVDAELITGPTHGAEGSLESAFDACGAKLLVLPHLVRPVHPVRDLLALGSLTRLFRQKQPQIVHTHSGKAGVLGRLAAKRAGVPLVIHTIHGPSFGPWQGAVPNLLYLRAERYAARSTTHFVAVAQAMKDQYLRAGIGGPEQYTVIPSGFTINAFLNSRNDHDLRAKLGIDPKDIVVGKIARLFALKGHEDLLAVAPQLVRACPRLKFLLVGDGEWRGRFERQSRETGLAGHFIFTGLVSPDTVPRLIGIMDILIHLSRREGLARALPQAAAAARPLVAYDCDGAKEVCLEGETGFLVAPGDHTLLAARVLELARDSALRRAMGERGRRLVRDRFSAPVMVDAIHDLYRKLLSEHA